MISLKTVLSDLLAVIDVSSPQLAQAAAKHPDTTVRGQLHDLLSYVHAAGRGTHEVLSQMDEAPNPRLDEIAAAPRSSGSEAPKRRRCSNCGEPGHRRSTCENPPSRAHEDDAPRRDRAIEREIGYMPANLRGKGR